MAPATENAVQVLTEAKSNNYQVVAFALDLTGKKPIDEICHISAYHGPNTAFDQYIMPYRDISRSSVRSHGIRIFTMFGKYRVLKDMNTMKTLHTKSEYSTLNDFVKWLSDLVQGSSSEGIILAFHDSGAHKVTPFLMTALERHGLTEEFFKIVKGFVNCNTVASTHPDIKGRSLVLRSLARLLLGADEKVKKSTSVSTDSDGQKTDSSDGTTDSDEKTEKKDDEKKKKGLTNGEKGKNKRNREFNVMQRANHRALTTYQLLQKVTTTPDDLFGDKLLKFLSSKEEVCKFSEVKEEVHINN